MANPKHTIRKLDKGSVRLINENFRAALDELKLANFAGGEINTGDVIVNQNYIQTNNIITGTHEVVVVPGDDIQEKIDSIAATGGIVVIRNGYYALTDDIAIPSGVYLRGETIEGVMLDFLDNTHGIKVTGTNVYTTGTATATAGSDTITGSGTAWLTETAPGQKILIGESWFLIIDVVSDTELQIEIPFSWPTVTNGAYIIATTVDDFEIKTLTILNADYGVYIEYANNFLVESVYTMLCGGGLYCANSASMDMDNQYNIYNLYGSIYSNVKLAFINANYSLGAAAGSGHSFTGLSNSTIANTATAQSASHGLEMISCTNVIVSGTIQSNTANGVLIDTCSDIALSNLATKQNGAHGIGIVGSTNIALDVAVTTQNVGNGVNVSNSAMVLSTNGHTGENGGYGMLYDATCVDCGVIGSGFHNNASGDISDAGTGTKISGTTGTGNKNLNNILPSQTGNTGKVLKTDGTDATWQTESVASETDPVYAASEAASFAAGDAAKLSGIEAGAEVNVQSDWTQATNTADDYIKNKPTFGTAAAKNIPATGNASATEVVYGSDTRLHAPGSDNQDLSGLIPKTTNITALNETGIADGELAVFNLTNKDIRTSNVTIATSVGADHTTVPTSQAVAEAITAGGGYTDEMAQDAVGGILANTGNVQFTYTDSTPSITAAVDLSGKQDTLVSATNIKTINSNSLLGSGDLAISGGGLTWNDATTSVTATVNNGYIIRSSSLVTITLPSSASVGDKISVLKPNAESDFDSGLWKIAQNASQTICFGDQASTLGATGYIQATSLGDSVEIVYCGYNNWAVVGSVGNITIA